MHVALNGWFWNQPDTGSGLYLRELLKALVKLDESVRYTLVVPTQWELDHLPSRVEIHRVNGAYGSAWGKVWFEQVAFPRALRQLQPDLAHIPYWAPPMSAPVPFITSVLDVIPLLIPEYSNTLASRLYTSLVSATVHGSAKILTLSESSKADVVEHLKLPPESVLAIPLAPREVYHPKMGQEHDEAVRQKYGLPDKGFVVYVGGFDVRKRVRQLLMAYTFVARAHGDETPLVLVGKEPAWREPMFPNLRQAAQELNLPSENLHWVGYVDEADMPSIYRLAEVFVSSTAYEGFGLPVLEAMASGTPVVANEIPVFNELVGDGAFLVPNGNATRMGGAIIALLEQENIYNSVRNNGLAQASNYTWRKTARATLSAYQDVFADTPKRSSSAS
ncbi:MAG: glycosyltransferase family 4 protein [Phototrophicaceae bacterium]